MDTFSTKNIVQEQKIPRTGAAPKDGSRFTVALLERLQKFLTVFVLYLGYYRQATITV